MQKFDKLTGVAAPLNILNIDTDMIIAKQFLKTIKRTGLGVGAFYEMRFNADGSEKPDFVLNKPEWKGTSILVAGDNFGCGSSREHAPQAILRAGFNAVIAGSFAEIFFGNSTTLGMPCVTLTADQISLLREAVEADPATEITVDVDKLEVRSSAGHTFNCAIPDSARDALINGRWDPIQELLDNEEKTSGVGEALPYV